MFPHFAVHASVSPSARFMIWHDGQVPPVESRFGFGGLDLLAHFGPRFVTSRGSLVNLTVLLLLSNVGWLSRSNLSVSLRRHCDTKKTRGNVRVDLLAWRQYSITRP